MSIIVASTMSDSGKSFITAGLVKILNSKPLKVQNMSLNSISTHDGGEIAFIQAYQAIGSRITPERFMNPILLKPMGNGIEVVYMGESLGIMKGEEYYDLANNKLWLKISEYLKRNDLVIEAAGGLGEPNFIHKDITAIKVMKELKIPAILVLDIDRGGAFSSAYGTFMMLPDSIRSNLKGFIINKFRGDERFLFDAIKWLEEKTGMKYLGYIPYLEESPIMPEDSMNIYDIGDGDKEVAIIAYPYMSNFNEFYAFKKSNAHVYFAKKPKEIVKADLVILPGSRNTLESLNWLVSKGFIDYIKNKRVLGICGGFQILGRKILDPYGIESGKPSEYNGLGIFDFNVYYDKRKIVSMTKAISNFGEIEGYEIRRGIIRYQDEKPIIEIVSRNNMKVSVFDGAYNNNFIGLSIHGSLFSEGGKKLLKELSDIEVYSSSMNQEIQSQVSLIETLLNKYLHLDEIMEIYKA
ncbi:cobyric acid synthase [Sulfolobus sp. A20-N-F6]|uniref:cobyric acid synthase n=2 Tax=Sulfolobaceae TaxID=118883 RepID=UPI000845F6F2|nr:cobyric acid synthase [Sulfolobus sp. A20]TRM76345.1 cobyric acid synthase [Sulfolobus sp. E5]TRM76452.1 cobyric acid synthase [Sulfolobus sp. A20-N-F8]TRM76574.1 cobyric acid synthase [Sulfolobus sp. B5]TRM81197.1 cobyric acid synthase [Sulfolobus sp. D5]TRM83307.1 cobyric acid synthase [Sulfolobus sp. A20-N-F6]TRM89750.1 cobyric acid synthase [Sulfolobus sp. C3]TRN03468.1 cobyric acid synthase [Sulfolobus sp. E1]